jgi:hypothetical protein
MASALLPPQSSVEHTTILLIGSARAESYCALTTPQRDGDQLQCIISRRLGAREPSFAEAVRYVKTTFYPNRAPDAVLWIDHEFEVLANCGLLHRFESVRVEATEETNRKSVDLATHQAWTARVLPAVRLLLKIGV